MADSTVQSNNKAVAFRGRKERAMPSPPGMDVSAKPGTKRDGVKNTAPMKMGRAKRKVAKRAIARGMISEKAAKKHLGDTY